MATEPVKDAAYFEQRREALDDAGSRQGNQYSPIVRGLLATHAEDCRDAALALREETARFAELQQREQLAYTRFDDEFTKRQQAAALAIQLNDEKIALTNRVERLTQPSRADTAIASIASAMHLMPDSWRNPVIQRIAAILHDHASEKERV